MTQRSNLREVRNPVLALQGVKRLQTLPPEVRQAIADLFADIRDDARDKAQKSWLKNKGPMAAYWKAVGAYAEHIRRVIKP
ncbi:MAG: hypothetical protein KIT02_10420 [Devosia sp.]|uniref:hypothetical protein n=1 Tax=Devosia sp. TaxID=1871048 RepID=UPI0024C67D2B|nr:hypothetical protein [Devosia sp.]UYN98380.1 MAG: hypothetical protein KIT02_10420 [Devosia sp.]